MKTSPFSISLVSAAAFLAGCQPKSADVAALVETIVVGPEYSPSKGLFVPDDTREAIGLKIVDVGEQKLSAVAEVSLRIYANTREGIRASGLVSSEQAKLLKPGQSLQVRTSDGRDVPAKLVTVDDKMQAGSGSAELLVEFAPSSDLAVGAFVRATLTTEGTGPVATVPHSALVKGTEGYFVYAVSGKHFVRTPVKVGTLTADAAEIKEGLYTGDQVVSQAAMSLWMTELAAVKGGQACCALPVKGK
jgi:hypothetical protein